MKQFGSNCPSCPFIKEGKTLKINGSDWNINKQLNLNSYNVVYAIICLKDNCREVYIEESKRILKYLWADHHGYITNGVISQATGAHFKLPGHSLADFSATIIEQTKKNNSEYRKEREHYYIRKCNTFYRGINKQKWGREGFSVLWLFVLYYLIKK